MITLDNADFSNHGEAVLALDWYKHLSDVDREKYIASLGKYRAQIIKEFTLHAMHYVAHINANGFDIDTLSDLWQRIRVHLRAYD